MVLGTLDVWPLILRANFLVTPSIAAERLRGVAVSNGKDKKAAAL